MKNNNNNNLEMETLKSGMEFKEHRQFFIDFFDKRNKFLVSLAKGKSDLEDLKESYLILIYLIEFTSSYIFKNNKNNTIDEDLKEITDIIKDKTKHQETFSKIQELFRKISLLQVESEILPKPLFYEEKDQETFWKEEENKALKEMKKSFTDSILKY